jgi:CheY-like chemotaxis protein
LANNIGCSTQRNGAAVTAVTDDRKYSILIADDDEAHRSALREIFAPYGFRTLLASNANEALTTFEFEAVHCLLLDMHMPDLTGLETMRIVRRRRQWLPCIIITADESRETRQQAFESQAFSVLSKPVNRELVVFTVRRALHHVYEPWLDISVPRLDRPKTIE